MKRPQSNAAVVAQIYEAANSINANLTIFEKSDLYECSPTEVRGWTEDDYEYALRILIESINEQQDELCQNAIRVTNDMRDYREANK
jgi:hypothetical protein